MLKSTNKIILILSISLPFITMNLVFAQDITSECTQEVDFCKAVFHGGILGLNDRIFGDTVLGNRTISQINNDIMLSGQHGAFKQLNEATYFLKINHVDPSTIIELSPLALEVLEYNKSGLHQYFGNVTEFTSLPDYESTNATKCSPQNLDYYKKVYNSIMYSFNGYFVTHELLDQNLSISNVNDELFRMAQYGVYNKVNDASFCLGFNNVNRSSLAQPLVDTTKVLNYNTTRLQQYLPDFAGYSSLPEFPFTMPILLISIILLIIFYRIRISKIRTRW